MESTYTILEKKRTRNRSQNSIPRRLNTTLTAMDRRRRSHSARYGHEQRGLTEGITTHHATLPPAATYNRNINHITIDGIWRTQSIINIERAGYLPFDAGCPSDHRTIWLDIDSKTALGIPQPHIIRSITLKLNTRDPRMRNKYTDILRQDYKKHTRFKCKFEFFILSGCHSFLSIPTIM